MNEPKRTNGEEVNLEDLLFYCIKKWRWVAAAMLFMAVLLGGYKYYSAVKGNQLAIQQWDESEAEENKEVYDADVLQYLRSAMWELSESIQVQEDYLENSLVMQLDANHLERGILSYVLKTEDPDSDQNSEKTLAAAYRAYVTDGRLAQLLYAEDENIETADLQYLVKFSNTFFELTENDRLSVDVRQYEPEYGIFQIQILSEDADSCERYLETAKRELQTYSESLQEQIGSHELVLLDSCVSEGQDQELMDYQQEILNNYKTMANDLNLLRTNAAACATSAGTGAAAPTGPALVNPVRTGVRYGIVGLVLGACIMGAVLIMRSLLSDRLRSVEKFENRFDMRMLSRVIEPIPRKRIFGFLDRLFLRLGEGTYANLSYEEQLKIAAANVKAAMPKKAGDTHIMIAGSIASKDVVELCLAVTQGNEGATFSDYHQLVFDASALEELSACDGVLFIEKKDVSSARLILQERKLAEDRGIAILGTIIL